MKSLLTFGVWFLRYHQWKLSHFQHKGTCSNHKWCYILTLMTSLSFFFKLFQPFSSSTIPCYTSVIAWEQRVATPWWEARKLTNFTFPLGMVLSLLTLRSIHQTEKTTKETKRSLSMRGSDTTPSCLNLTLDHKYSMFICWYLEIYIPGLNGSFTCCISLVSPNCVVN